VGWKLRQLGHGDGGLGGVAHPDLAEVEHHVVEREDIPLHVVEAPDPGAPVVLDALDVLLGLAV
jgi:hypothetical protein